MQEFREQLHRIDVTLARQEENLREHMRRSEALEKQVEQMRKQMLLWAFGIAGALAMQLLSIVLHK